MENKYRKGEVIWAKVRGFPWWPGVIKNISIKTVKQKNYNGEDVEVKEVKFIVNFIGDNSHAELPSNKVDKFHNKLEEYSRTRKKDLLTSINLAKKINPPPNVLFGE